MPESLLNKDTSIKCMHGGDARPDKISDRVKVDGKPIVTQLSSYSITGCGLSSGPCSKALIWTKVSQRVFCDKVPVLLQSSQTTCIPSGGGVIIVKTQNRVKGR